MESTPESRHYEFDGSQNSLIQDLSQKMQFVSYFFMVMGGLTVIGGLFTLFKGGLSNIITGVIYFVIGLWTGKAASSFKMIVDTEGNDIENLIGALGELRKLYSLQYWLLIIGIVFLALTVILGVISGVMTGGQ